MKRALFVKSFLTIMLLLALGVVMGCGEKDKPQSNAATVSQKDLQEKTKEAYRATKTYTQEQIQAFREEMETRLTTYKKDIDQWQAKTETLEGDAKATAEQQLKDLRQKRDEVSEKLKGLGSSGEQAWDQIKSGIDSAMEDLGKAYQKVAAQFNKS